MGKLPRPLSPARVGKHLDLVGHLEELDNDIPLTLPTPVSLTILQSSCSLSTLQYSTPEEPSTIWALFQKMSTIKTWSPGMPLKLMAPFFFTSDDVTVCYPLGKPLINMDNPFLANSFEIQSLALDVSTF